MVTERAGEVGGWAAHARILDRHIFEVNQTLRELGGHASSPTTAAAFQGPAPHPRLVSRWIVPAGAEVQIHPAALPLDVIVILGRTVQWPCEQRCCVMDGVLNGR
jgi:hypothetical protein